MSERNPYGLPVAPPPPPPSPSTGPEAQAALERDLRQKAIWDHRPLTELIEGPIRTVIGLLAERARAAVNPTPLIKMIEHEAARYFAFAPTIKNPNVIINKMLHEDLPAALVEASERINCEIEILKLELISRRAAEPPPPQPPEAEAPPAQSKSAGASKVSVRDSDLKACKKAHRGTFPNADQTHRWIVENLGRNVTRSSVRQAIKETTGRGQGRPMKHE